MTEQLESGQDIELYGKSGRTYTGKIYGEKNSSSSIRTPAIVCLSNSHQTNGEWQHAIRDIYDTQSAIDALNHFKERDDLSHMILLPKDPAESSGFDAIDDLRRNYIHK